MPKVEWSGILFYKPNGKILSEGFSIDLVDVLLMDRGNKVFTSYSFNHDVVEYMMANQELLDCKMGHIHSHNDMSVFFSGTDDDELVENSDTHNYYLSLIVNNYMDFIAKIAWRGTATIDSVDYTCKDSDGSEYTIPGKPIVKQVGFYLNNCKIISPKEEIMVPDTFKERMEHIFKETERKEKEKAEAAKKAAAQNTANKGQNLPAVPVMAKGAYNPANSWGEFPGWVNNEAPIQDIEPVETMTETEEFLCNILRMGWEIPEDSVSDALNDLETFMTKQNMTAPQLGRHIMDKHYDEEYHNFYDLSNVEDKEACYREIKGEVIELLQVYADMYDYVPAIITALSDNKKPARKVAPSCAIGYQGAKTVNNSKTKNKKNGRRS